MKGPVRTFVVPTRSGEVTLRVDAKGCVSTSTAGDLTLSQAGRYLTVNGVRLDLRDLDALERQCAVLQKAPSPTRLPRPVRLEDFLRRLGFYGIWAVVAMLLYLLLAAMVRHDNRVMEEYLKDLPAERRP